MIFSSLHDCCCFLIIQMKTLCDAHRNIWPFKCMQPSKYQTNINCEDKPSESGENCIFIFLIFCSNRAVLSCLCMQRVRQKERRWRGRNPEGREERVGGGLEMEGVLTCTCLQSLRIHFTIHLLCLYCHGWGQSVQTHIRSPQHPP